MVIRLFGIVAAVLMGARSAWACPVCIGGAATGDMLRGMNMGVLSMLLVVAGMLSGFAGFFIYLMRRSAHRSL